MYWRKMHEKMRSDGQTLTIITLIIGVIFVFIVFGLQMRKAAFKRVVMANAADSSVLLLASQLSSYANKLSQQFADGADQKCDFDWLAILTIVCFSLALVLSFFTGPIGVAGMVGLMQAAGTLLIGTGVAANFYSVKLQLDLAKADRYFKAMVAEQSLPESAIKNAFFACVDDLTLVNDTNDDDEDGLTNDTIYNSTKFYFKRLRHLLSTSDYLGAAEDFDRHLVTFDPGCDPMLPDFYGKTGFLRVTRDCGPPVKINDAVIPAFDQGGNLIMDGTSPMSFADWLKGPFITLLDDLNNLTYTVPNTMYNLTAPGGQPDDPIDITAMEIYRFENWALEDILKTSYNAAVFNQWYSQLNSATGNSWRDKLDQWKNNVDSWINELQDIEDNIIQPCVQNCAARKTDTGPCNGDFNCNLTGINGTINACSYVNGTNCLAWINVSDSWINVCDVWSVPGCTTVNATDPMICDSPANVTCSSEDLFVGPPTDTNDIATAENPLGPPTDTNDICTSWNQVEAGWLGGCCGPVKTNCEICNQAPCNATIGAPGACCNTCCTILNVLGDNTTSKVSAAISVLGNFRNQLNDPINGFIPYLDTDFFPRAVVLSDNVEMSRNLDYPWNDARGEHQLRIKLDFAQPSPFKLPYVEHYRDNVLWNCVAIRKHHGKLHMTISRWDREPQPAGWINVTGGIFANLLNWDKSTTVDAWAHYGIRKEEVGLGERAVDCNGGNCTEHLVW